MKEKLLKQLATFGKIERRIIESLTALIFLAGNAVTCYADDIISKAGSMANTYYNALFGILFSLAGVCCITALIWTFLEPTTQGSRTPISWGKKIILCVFLACVLGGIFTAIKNATAGLEFTPS